MKTVRGFVGLTMAAMVALTGCANDTADPTARPALNPPAIEKLQSLGIGEGSVRIVSWAGYVEDGGTDKAADWVSGFEKSTGCQVSNTVAGTSDEMVALMSSGDYDLVSASGDATLRLIYGGYVAPVNTDLVPNYQDIFDALKLKAWNSVNGVAYGIPHGRGANLLMWRTDMVKPAPTSWAAMFDAASPYRGKITIYDSPIYIADAALYLMNHNPELGIRNPYALDAKQFRAVIDLLKVQNTTIGRYWSDYSSQVRDFASGASALGTTWQVITNLAQADKVPVAAILPDEGATGWSDTWMISAKAKHPTCAYLWMNHIVSPEANAAVAEWFGEAPANRLACQKTKDRRFCATYHASDEAYFSKIWYWSTPLTQCLDGRTDVICKDYVAWTQAWTEIKG